VSTFIMTTNENRTVRGGSSDAGMISAPTASGRVRIARGLRCRCGRQIRPNDVECFDDTVWIICGGASGCHHTIIEIELRV
jgi:hypothetical protein